MTNIMDLDTKLLGINQISFARTDIVAYFKNLDGVNSFYLVFNDVDVLSALMKINTWLFL